MCLILPPCLFQALDSSSSQGAASSVQGLMSPQQFAEGGHSAEVASHESGSSQGQTSSSRLNHEQFKQAMLQLIQVN